MSHASHQELDRPLLTWCLLFWGGCFFFVSFGFLNPPLVGSYSMTAMELLHGALGLGIGIGIDIGGGGGPEKENGGGE